MNSIGVVTDSHSGILPEVARKLGIMVLPMPFYFEKECLANEMSISKFLPRRFFLWQNAACVFLCFFIFSTFKYWLAVFILEFLFLLAIWYYGLLVSTLVKEEQKLYQIQSSSGSGQ